MLLSSSEQESPNSQHWETLPSLMDASVNHVLRTNDGGFWESRYVQRAEDYLIIYLSSHTGCKHACRFCHLTATAQSMMTPATVEDYLDQARRVWEDWQVRETGFDKAKLQRVHYNFMARGEALSNPYFLAHSHALMDRLSGLTHAFAPVESKGLVSTILPRGFQGNLAEVLGHPDFVPFYSLYTLDQAKRKRWLPQAMPGLQALDLWQIFQIKTGKDLVLHWAFIEGVNNDEETVDAIAQAIQERDLRVRFNLVRYNPPPHVTEQEPNEEKLMALFQRLEKACLVSGSRMVPRVGFDVKASCGMFVGERRS